MCIACERTQVTYWKLEFKASNMFGAKPFPTMKILMLFKKKLAKKRTDDDRNSFHFILWVNLSLIDRSEEHTSELQSLV